MGIILFNPLPKNRHFLKLIETKMQLSPEHPDYSIHAQNTQKLSVNGYLAKGGKYKDALAQNISKAQSKRGIISVRVSDDRIRSTAINHWSLDLQSVLGYNSPKTINRNLIYQKNRSKQNLPITNN